MPRRPAIEEVLAELGFERSGRGRRAREQELRVALESLETVATEIGETGRKLEIWEIGDLAKALRPSWAHRSGNIPARGAGSCSVA
ncbi:MAG: hypothetical protein H0U03_10520 [Actinobacteria bacterium]|nr:hypothetical protein [Actinomycetota bacterium]